MSNIDVLDTATKLFASYHGPGSEAVRIGEAALDVLLFGRTANDLSAAEMHCLLKAYNWASQGEEGFKQAKNAVGRWGDEFLEDLDCALHNSYYWPKGAYVSKVDELIADCIGPPAHWHLRKADWWVMEATGEHDGEEVWFPGDEIANPSALDQAALCLDAAIRQSPPGATLPDQTWQERFAPVLEQSRFARFLASEA